MTTFHETISKTISCPVCGCDRLIKSGKQRGEQRYLCKGCKCRFRAGDRGMGQRVSVEQKGAAVRLFYSGMSYKQIGESMADMFDIPEPSKRAIYEWVREYTDAASEAMKQHPAQVGTSWVADEMYLKVGGQQLYNWNIMDEKTRYILASYLSKERDAKAAREVMRRAKEAAGTTPDTIKTDKWRAYIRPIKEVFPDATHIQSEGLAAEVNNNVSERLQGTFRQRTKTLRGLDSQETGQRYLDGWVINYNLFREHEGLKGKTPGEAARVRAPFDEWADVVRQTEAVPQVVVKSVSSPKAEVPAPKVAAGGCERCPGEWEAGETGTVSVTYPQNIPIADFAAASEA